MAYSSLAKLELLYKKEWAEYLVSRCAKIYCKRLAAIIAAQYGSKPEILTLFRLFLLKRKNDASVSFHFTISVEFYMSLSKKKTLKHIEVAWQDDKH